MLLTEMVPGQFRCAGAPAFGGKCRLIFKGRGPRPDRSNVKQTHNHKYTVTSVEESAENSQTGMSGPLLSTCFQIESDCLRKAEGGKQKARNPQVYPSLAVRFMLSAGTI